MFFLFLRFENPAFQIKPQGIQRVAIYRWYSRFGSRAHINPAIASKMGKVGCVGIQADPNDQDGGRVDINHGRVNDRLCSIGTQKS